MTNDHFIKIGTITKPHGINGEMILRFDGQFVNELEEGEPLFVELDGSLVPFFIETIRGGDDMAFVKLEFISSDTERLRLRGNAVFVNANSISTIVSIKQDGVSYTGWVLRDERSSFSGIIREYISEKDNPLFILEKDGKDYYIPLQEEFILKIDHKKKIILMDLPEGLLDIND
jgi:16S rRNA processing protein RimM